jgi:hypothetical protein
LSKTEYIFFFFYRKSHVKPPPGYFQIGTERVHRNRQRERILEEKEEQKEEMRKKDEEFQEQLRREVC